MPQAQVGPVNAEPIKLSGDDLVRLAFLAQETTAQSVPEMIPPRAGVFTAFSVNRAMNHLDIGWDAGVSLPKLQAAGFLVPSDPVNHRGRGLKDIPKLNRNFVAAYQLNPEMRPIIDSVRAETSQAIATHDLDGAIAAAAGILDTIQDKKFDLSDLVVPARV